LVALASAATYSVSLQSPPDRPSAAQEVVPSAAYTAYARAQIEREFKKGAHRAITEDELAEALRLFEQRARELPDEIARVLIESEHRNLEARADLETGGALAFARNLAGGGAGPLEDLVATREGVDRLFARKHEELRVAVARPGEIARSLAPAATLAFGAGAYELGNFFRTPEAFPADVTLAGAGRDSTLFVLREPLDAGGALERFTLRDATVLLEQGRLFDQGVGPGIVRLAGLRVIGFDRRGGKDGALRFVEALVLDARACRFEGGFGDLPGAGTLLDVPREALLARIEGCAFERMALRLSRHPRGTTLRFVGCELEVFDDPLADAEHRRGIRLIDCEIQRADRERDREARRDVEELFPGWREQLVR
jgi:hypothetical protein